MSQNDSHQRNYVKRFSLAFLLTSTLSLSHQIALAQIEVGDHLVDFHGYIRTGLGTAEDGATQVQFQLPDIPSSYRLGNEPNTNLELAFDYRYKLDESADNPDDSYIQGVFMADEFENFGNSNDLGLDRIAQAYIKFNNIMDNGLDFWAGRIYYDRKGIHLNDHFWLNPSQGAHAGVGVEGIDLGFATGKLSAFQYEDSGVEALDDSGETGTLKSNSIDFRIGGIETGANSNLNFVTEYYLRHDNVAGFDDEDGFVLGAWHDNNNLFGGSASNTVAVIYRSGAGVVQGTFNARPAREDQGFDLDDAESWEINNNFLIEPNDKFSMQWGVVLRNEDRGNGEDIRWYSTGIRPIYYISDHLNIAWETGIDWTDNEVRDVEGHLIKSTLALQIANGRGYFNRPVLRFFATYADWDDDLVGLVGTGPGDDSPYIDDSDGWTLGAHVEAWW